MQTSPTQLSLVSACLVLSVASASRADDDAAFEKATQFTAALQRSIDGVAKDCKLQLAITTNVAVADLSVWGGNPKHPMRSVAAPCAAAIDAIRSLCTLNKNTEAWRQVTAREVKGVRCQLTGHQPKKKGETADAWMRRNVTFVNGVLTVKMSPHMRSPGEVAAFVVFRDLVDRPGAPTLIPDDEEPAQEETRDEPKPREQERAAKPKGSEKGRMCSKDKDCQSGACKMENKTRGRCQ